jgi:hypothetical protein
MREVLPQNQRTIWRSDINGEQNNGLHRENCQTPTFSYSTSHTHHSSIFLLSRRISLKERADFRVAAFMEQSNRSRVPSHKTHRPELRSARRATGCRDTPLMKSGCVEVPHARAGRRKSDGVPHRHSVTASQQLDLERDAGIKPERSCVTPRVCRLRCHLGRWNNRNDRRHQTIRDCNLLKAEPTNERIRCMLSLDRDHSSFAPASASCRSCSTAASNSLPLRFLYRMIPLWSIT